LASRVGVAGGLRAAIGLSLITALVLLGAQGGTSPRLAGKPVTLEAAALIGLGYYLSQSAWLAGVGYWTLYRPLVAGLLVGMVLGDPWAGARIGATLNIAFLGFLGTGGALPTDIALVGYVGATVALATGLSATVSLALSLPFGLLGYGLYRVRLRWSDGLARRAAGYARHGDVRGIARYNVLVPQSMLLLLAWVPGTATAYLTPVAARAMAQIAPDWVVGWLHLTGALLVALGAAAGLALVWMRRTAACFLGGVGVALAAVGPEMAVWAGVLSAAASMAVPWVSRGRAGEGVAPTVGAGLGPGTGREARTDGPVRGRDRLASVLTWLFFSHGAYSEEGRQAVGLAHALAPVLRRLYPEPSELGRALTRYLAPFNVEPNLGSALIGALGREEEALARGRAGSGVPQETRAQLAGPISGVGDTVIHGAVGTLAIALGVAIATVAGPAGAILYSVVMVAVVWGVSGWAFRQGYRGGLPGVLRLLRGAAWRRVVVGAECAGAILLGTLAAGPVAGLFASSADAVRAGQGTLAGRVVGALPGVALVLALLALERWGLRQRVVTAACYGIGLVVVLLRL
jgi:mannose/fructose/N-acetylgalactosamine-specific phosphotransferase system component IIC/mannose/fructose/N-acetylgalactosamine-specific phosphotransferase system component IID